MRPSPTQHSLIAPFASLSLLVVALGACDGGGTEVPWKPPVVVVEVVPEVGTVVRGQSLPLTATPKDANGTVLKRTVTWATSDPNVASVNAQGLVIGELPGTVTITARSEGTEGHATIKVIEPGAYNCSTQSEIPQEECWALVALFEATNGPDWLESTGWLANATPCSWHGVTCPPSPEPGAEPADWPLALGNGEHVGPGPPGPRGERDHRNPPSRTRDVVQAL